MKIDGTWFKDEHGRILLLRGVNLGGSSKVPFQPNGATHIREGFYHHRDVSFVGRPFPLHEADEHFARLKAWGFTFLRFLVTWEAIEHAGPGLYDEAYLDYVTAVVEKAHQYGINLFIDPHQDVWSRFSGGDGAPGWTFECLGMDITRFAETGAAIIHAIHGDPLPIMIWPTNNEKLAAATLFTLFFGGNDFAPHTTIDGVPAQEFLQRHYINAIKQVAMRLKELPNVVGYDTFNEPASGFIGLQDLTKNSGRLTKGILPSPFQAMLLGAGYSQELKIWDLDVLRKKVIGHEVVNPNGVSVWRDGCCLWRQNGVWDEDDAGNPHLRRPHHFAAVNGRPVDFAHHYFKPFANRYARQIRSVDPEALIFVEYKGLALPPSWGAQDAANVVNAAHWYDVITLMSKRFIPWFTVDYRTRWPAFGRKGVQRLFARQLAEIKKAGSEAMGGVPTLIGEFGIPFDLNDGEAYRTGDFAQHIAALDASFQALDANLLSGTLWNYTADNDNVHGDQWNNEDLSIFSRDQQTAPDDINSGGRALAAAVRPYARATAGEPLKMRFERKKRHFKFTFRHDTAVTVPSELFVPTLQYPQGYAVTVSDGRYEIDRDAQTLRYYHTRQQPVHTIHITPL